MATSYTRLLALAAALAAGAVSASPRGYVVAVDEATFAEPGWAEAAAELAARHGADTVRYGGIDGLPALVEDLRRTRPRYVCFVARPESAGRDFVTAASRAMRSIDDDPYGDAIWGIVTGFDAGDALRIASAPPSRTVRSYATSMGGPGSLDSRAAGIATDERSAAHFWTKRPGGGTVEVATDGNLPKALAGAFSSIPVDFFVASGHASERDWQVVYNQNKGRLVHTKDAKLRFAAPDGSLYPVEGASFKAFLGAGNCLIGHVDRRACMVTAWFHSGGMEQFAGYTVPSWYGFMGWGVNGLFHEGRHSLSEARFLTNERLVWATLRSRSERDGKGLAYDRDSFAFYGDPAQRIAFEEDRTPYEISVDGADVKVVFTRDCRFAPLDDVFGAVPVMALLDDEPPGDALFGPGGDEVADSVVTELFLFIPAPGPHAKGETLEFRIGKKPRAVPSP